MTNPVDEEPPTVGTLVDVILDRRTQPYMAQVLSASGRQLDIEPLTDRAGRRVSLEVDELGLMVWRGDVALVQAPFTVTGTARVGRPTWEAALSEQVSRAQRRSFVRVPASFPAEVVLAGESVPVEVRDLSEGGIRCLLDPQVRVQLGDEVQVVLPVPGLSGRLEATVVRRQLGSTVLPTHLGLRFADLRIADADALRRHVFALMRESRQREMA